MSFDPAISTASDASIYASIYVSMVAGAFPLHEGDIDKTVFMVAQDVLGTAQLHLLVRPHRLVQVRARMLGLILVVGHRCSRSIRQKTSIPRISPFRAWLYPIYCVAAAICSVTVATYGSLTSSRCALYLGHPTL